MARGSRVGAGGIRCGGPRASGSGGSASRSPIVVPAAACATVAAMVVVAGVAWIPLTGCQCHGRSLESRRPLCAAVHGRGLRYCAGHDLGFLG
jgi:hypothetical protein